jgi:RNA polymerase sigma factor (sigma-70 family)
VRSFGQTGAGLDDASLISRSLSDGRSFDSVFDRHYPAVRRFLAVQAGADVADDLASETFTVAFRRRGSYDLSRPNAAPWLYGIALNLLRRHRRSEASRRHVYMRVAAGLGVPGEISVEGFDANGRVSMALGLLRERDRELIVLYAWAGLSYEELAAVFGLPIGTVRSRLSRVRAQLREHLGAPEVTI